MKIGNLLSSLAIREVPAAGMHVRCLVKPAGYTCQMTWITDEEEELVVLGGGVPVLPGGAWSLCMACDAWNRPEAIAGVGADTASRWGARERPEDSLAGAFEGSGDADRERVEVKAAAWAVSRIESMLLLL